MFLPNADLALYTMHENVYRVWCFRFLFNPHSFTSQKNIDKSLKILYKVSICWIADGAYSTWIGSGNREIFMKDFKNRQITLLVLFLFPAFLQR